LGHEFVRPTCLQEDCKIEIKVVSNRFLVPVVGRAMPEDETVANGAIKWKVKVCVGYMVISK
jgi:hypothetical protein